MQIVLKWIRRVLKGIGVIFLLWLAMHLWFALSPLFLPDPPADMPGPPTVQEQLRGLAEARQAGGPEAEEAYREQLERSRPFDNSMVIYYMFPLLLVWLLCAVGRARQISPISIVGALTLLWLAAYLAIQVLTQVVILVAPHAGTIGHYFLEGLSHLSDKSLWKLALVGIGIVVVLIFRAPVFIVSLLLYVPRRFDRALVDLLNDEDGWLAQRHGASAAQAGHVAAILLLAGIAGWILWRACDGLDGGGIPDTFALFARGGVVAFGAFLLVRTHLRETG